MAIERRNAERKRRASDHLFQAMFMAMDEGAVTRNRNGEIVAVNPAAENILGLAAAEWIGRPSADFARALNFIREDETSFPWELHPATLALQTGTPQRNVLMGAHRPDGRLVWISVNAQALLSDGESGPSGVVTTFRDVTERKRTEDALWFVAQRGWMDGTENFFDALAQYLGRTLGVAYVLVVRLDDDPSIAQTVALYAKGNIVANLRYSLKGTPCENVLGRKFCFYPQGIRQMFPEDSLLVEMGADGYAGLPLWDSAGQPIGLIAVLDVKPLRDEAQISQILQFMATRAAAELERERNDRILRQSEREFRSLAENMPDNVVRYDRQARVQYMNPAFMANIAPEVLPVLGESPVETYPDRDAAAGHRRMVEQVIATGTPTEVEFQLPNPHGEMRIHHARCVAERNDNGEIVGVLGIGRDITERKQAEEYEQFRSRTLELLSGGASLPAILEGIVRGVEQLSPGTMCSILLLDNQGKRLGEGIAPSLPDFYKAAVDGIEIGVGIGCCGTAAATGERVIVEDIQTHPYWAPYKELAASAGLGACWSEPIHSSTGQVLGTFATYHREAHWPAEFDISIIEKSTHLASIAIERRQAEEALRASEQEFRTLAENLPDPLVRYDREGRRTYVNPAMERRHAVTAGQFIGRTLREANPTGMTTAETYQRALEHTLAAGERSEVEVHTPMPGGNIRTALAFIAAERAADGRILGAIAVSRDITERKRSEAELEQHRQHLERMVEERTRALLVAKETAEAATRAKSRFLAAASHDLRQPLQAIGLFNDALAKTELDERQKKISGYLSTSVKSLGDLLNKLLDISRLDAGTIEPQPVAIQAEDLMEMIGAEFDAVSREKNLGLNLFCPRRGLALFCDDNMLRTLLRNLVGNAVKYTARGGVLVGIRRRGERALIQVWDTGVGIAPEHTDAIFEEYFQVGNPERDRAQGVGLGLAIVRRLSNMLDLGVRVRSRAGKGSVFELSVPLASRSDAQALPMPASASMESVASARLSGKRIVVIEDDATAAEALRLSLEMEGARVTLFGTAEAALESAKTIGADYYISDYRLPGMDGRQLLDAVQAISAEPIKAVILTGNTLPDQIGIMQSSGWKVLFKPIDGPRLLSALDALEVVY